MDGTRNILSPTEFKSIILERNAPSIPECTVEIKNSYFKHFFRLPERISCHFVFSGLLKPDPAVFKGPETCIDRFCSPGCFQ